MRLPKATTSNVGTELTHSNDSSEWHPPFHRLVHNTRFVQLHEDEHDEINDANFKLLLRAKFIDIEKCIDYINTFDDKYAVIIVSVRVNIENLKRLDRSSKVESIYVFDNDKSLVRESLDTNIVKVRGTFTTLDSISEAIKIDSEIRDRAETPIVLNGVDAIFMYTQLFKEAVLEIEDENHKSIADLIEYSRSKCESEITIQRLSNEYESYTPIWWYTAPTFIYSALNQGLRNMDGDIILHYGFFIRHLHNQIKQL